MHYIVYKTINMVNRKAYIGSHATNNLDDGYMGSGELLLRAVKKHGAHHFIRITLSEHDNQEDMLAAEQAALEAVDAANNPMFYNLKNAARGFAVGNTLCVGRIFSPESKAKMSASQKGNKNGLGNQSRKGKPHNPETRARIAKSNKGKVRTAEHAAKLSKALKGRKLSPEQRAAISARQKGRKLSREHVEKIAAAHRGMKRSPEARANMSKAQKARFAKNPMPRKDGRYALVRAR